MQISITLTEGALLIFLQSGVEKLLPSVTDRGFEPPTLDLSSQSGAYNLAATATPEVYGHCRLVCLGSLSQANPMK